MGFQFRSQLGEAVPDSARVLLPPGVLEDVLDDLLVLNRLDEPAILDRIPRVLEDEIRPSWIQARLTCLLDLAFDGMDEVGRGRLEADREGGGHFVRLREGERDFFVPSRFE